MFKYLKSSIAVLTNLFTFSADESPAVLEVLEEEGGGMVVEVDDWRQCDCAIQPEADEPRQHYHYFSIILLNKGEGLSFVGEGLQQLAAAWAVVQLLKPALHALGVH